MALLRSAPAATWNYYVAGAAPLLVAVVYGVSRASVHRMAPEEIGLGAVIFTLLFFWMSWAKIRFARGLYLRLSATSEPALDAGGVWPAATIQGTKLLLLPLSVLAVFPFAWTVSFYANITTLAKRPNVFKQSARMAGAWQRQNWFALGLLALFAFVIFLNVAILLGTLPVLARMLSGYENEFTRNPAAMFNATFAATAVGATWFLIDPLIQAMYVVRCFKGEAVGSGADLRAALRRLVVGFALALVTVSMVHARPVNPSDLDAKIRHALESPDYSWQNPDAPAAGDAEPGWMVDLSRLIDRVKHGVKVAVDWVGARIRDLFRNQHPIAAPGKPPPQTSLRWAIYGVLVLIALLAIGILRRAFVSQRSKSAAPGVTGQSIDLKGDVIASELPEDEWLRLAREAMERGDLRIALRAAYLASLASLGSAGLVAISRFKSNRDYEREVRLRSRSDEITALLKSNRVVFESAWYGDEQKAASDVEAMQRNLSRMRELAHA